MRPQVSLNDFSKIIFLRTDNQVGPLTILLFRQPFTKEVNIAFNISSSAKEILKDSSGEYNWTNKKCFSQSQSWSSELMDSPPVPADVGLMKNLSLERDACLSLSTRSRLFSLSHSLLSVSNLAGDLQRICCLHQPSRYLYFPLFFYCFF